MTKIGMSNSIIRQRYGPCRTEPTATMEKDRLDNCIQDELLPAMILALLKLLGWQMGLFFYLLISKEKEDIR